MRIGLQNTDWGFIGAKLAQEGDDEQIKFFKAFIKECKSWGTSFQVQTQLASINVGLDEEEQEILHMLGYQEE